MRSRSCSSAGLAGRKTMGATLYTTLLEEFGDEPGPARLVTCAQAGTVVPVKIFVKQDKVFPMGIVLKKVDSAGNRAAPVLAANKDVNEAAGDFRGDFPKIRLLGGARRALDFEIFTIVVMKFLQRFNEKIIQRKPNGAAPVRIAAEDPASRLGRLIIHAIDLTVYMDFVGMIEVIAGKGADAV